MRFIFISTNLSAIFFTCLYLLTKETNWANAPIIFHCNHRKLCLWEYLPGALTAGYTFQKTFAIYPAHTVSAGVHFSWNLQDLFSNKQVLKQRNLLLQQAKENIANTQEQLNAGIEKAYRKVLQAQALINVAVKVVYYRRNELKIQEDKRAAGLNTPADLLSAKAELAKSEADLYAAQLSSRLAISELNILAEGK